MSTIFILFKHCVNSSFWFTFCPTKISKAVLFEQIVGISNRGWVVSKRECLPPYRLTARLYLHGPNSCGFIVRSSGLSLPMKAGSSNTNFYQLVGSETVYPDLGKIRVYNIILIYSISLNKKVFVKSSSKFGYHNILYKTLIFFSVQILRDASTL